MANPQTHFRSISLPSRLHDPINPKNFEAQLQKLKSLQINSVPITSEAIQTGILGLAELYNSVQLKSSVPQDTKSIEESLSSSIQLLDVCSAIRDLFQMIKENVHALQSALRRKGQDFSSAQNDVASYFCFRKRMNKCTAKTLKTLKNLEQINNDSGLFRQLMGITIGIFRSILVFLSGPISRPGGWALVSKVMNIKFGGCEIDVINETGNVDFALKMRSNGATAQMVQKRLQNVDAMVEGFEGGLERLFRQLVQSRVTLLNILTDN
ncbi:hypothetical protein DH2020_034850 [Rehmannia glutinosa]|uniref:Uncharacterized protein n=1 Tax=Rehmannia glutinosa TaxID=99300 RepID=A0ABR0V974_REHGL